MIRTTPMHFKQKLREDTTNKHEFGNMVISTINSDDFHGFRGRSLHAYHAGRRPCWSLTRKKGRKVGNFSPAPRWIIAVFLR